MASPFNVPDEFVQGFFKSGQAFWQSFITQVGQPPSAALPEAPAWPGLPPWPLAIPNAAPLMQLQQRYFQQQVALWLGMVASTTGDSHEPVVAPERGDRRFHADGLARRTRGTACSSRPTCSTRACSTDMVEAAELDPKDKHKLRFFARQFIDSMSPANFAATNPEALKLALESQGESVQAGFANLLEDCQARPHLDHRRDRLRGRPQRGACPRARWCSRTSCSS